MADDDPRVRRWRLFLGVAAVLNVGLWVLVARATRGLSAFHDRELALSALFVGGCAYRSFFPTVYVKRLAVVDSLAASIFVTRVVATVAEVAFGLQVQGVLALWGEGVGEPIVGALGWAVALCFTSAQAFCWFAVATGRYVGELIEESLWTLGFLLILAGTLVVARHRFDAGVVGGLLASIPFIAFMTIRNLPLYLRRLRTADPTRHRGLVEGLRDAVLRRHVSPAWTDWVDDAAWLTPYFTFGVWVSLAMVLVPQRS